MAASKAQVRPEQLQPPQPEGVVRRLPPGLPPRQRRPDADHHGWGAAYPAPVGIRAAARLSPPQPWGAGYRSSGTGRSRSQGGRSSEGNPRSLGRVLRGDVSEHAATTSVAAATHIPSNALRCIHDLICGDSYHGLAARAAVAAGDRSCSGMKGCDGRRSPSRQHAQGKLRPIQFRTGSAWCRAFMRAPGSARHSSGFVDDAARPPSATERRLDA